MRGHIVKRAKDSYSLVLTLGTTVDPETGKKKKNQKWITVKGTKRAAETKLAELIHQYETGQFQEPTRMTVGEWLEKWLEVYLLPSTRKKPRTKETYELVTRNHLIPCLGSILLQRLQPFQIQDYYNKSTLAPATLEQHHAILHQALDVAWKVEKLIVSNPAKMVVEKPHAGQGQEMETWTAGEVQKFLAVAIEEGTQTQVFYTTAIETGMRKGELCGLKWDDVDLNRSRISVRRTLIKAGAEPVMGTPKSGRGRAIAISADLVRLLRKHKAEQNEWRLRLGDSYNNLDFVFAKQNGNPLQINNLGQREFRKLTEKAGIKQIRFHDLRHTCATLLLENDLHPKIVQERLGHSDISMTLNRYSHVTPTMQESAARLMGNILSNTT